MNPLIFKFVEKPALKDLDFSIIRYSKTQNLSVLKDSEMPAIIYASMETETFTKTGGEPTDSDRDYQLRIKSLFDTKTKTYTATEQSDSDNDNRMLRMLMDTKTITESVEATDSDK